YVAPGSEFAPGGAVTVAGSANNTTLPAIDGTVKLAVGLRQDKVGTSSILTLGSNNLTLAGSLFASSTSILSNSGTITFNATTTGRTIIATSSPLGNVTFNGVGGAWAFNAQASTTNLTITNGTVTAPSLLTINGNYSNSGTFTHNSGTIYFSGTANTLTSGGSSFNDVQVLSGASYALQDAMPIAGNLTLAGSLTGGSAVKLTGASKNLVGGNATLHSLWLNGSASYTLATSDLTVSTSTIESGATLTVGSGINLIATTTMTLLGTLASASLGNGTTTFGNASYACSNVPSTGTLSSNIRLDATAGDCTMPALSYSGNVEAYNNSASNRTVTMAGAVTLSGTANLFVNANSTGNAILAGPSAAVTVGGDFDFIGTGGGSEVLTTGNNTWTVSGNANFTNGTFVATSGNTWVMSGTTKNLAAVAPFENLTLSGTITLLSNASSTGNVILSGTVTPAGNTLYLLGTGKNITGGSNTIHSLWVQGTYTLITSNLTVSTTTIDSSKSLTIDTGHFLTATSTMTLNGSLLSTSLGNGTTTFGNGSFACPTIPSGGTLTGNVRFDATAGNCTIPGRTYGGNLEAYSNSSSAGRSVIMAGATTISGGLFINAANTQNITFDGATNNPAVTVTGDIDFVGTGSGAEILSTGTGNWVASGNANFTGGTLTAASANWLTMNGANATLTLAGAGSLANFSASSSITISGNATTTGSLLIGS
ncbi:hypothetical protein KGQ34_04325, partial [Patescibacteria group bacterium]|nr:hypothetical protein [Patescibacteria group bacterium]